MRFGESTRRFLGPGPQKSLPNGGALIVVRVLLRSTMRSKSPLRSRRCVVRNYRESHERDRTRREPSPARGCPLHYNQVLIQQNGFLFSCQMTIVIVGGSPVFSARLKR